MPQFDLALTKWTNELNKLCKNVFENGHPPLYQQPINFSKVTAIHKVKGKTFDSVMLVLSSNSSGQNISLNDYQRLLQIADEKNA